MPTQLWIVGYCKGLRTLDALVQFSKLNILIIFVLLLCKCNSIITISRQALYIEAGNFRNQIFICVIRDAMAIKRALINCFHYWILFVKQAQTFKKDSAQKRILLIYLQDQNQNLMWCLRLASDRKQPVLKKDDTSCVLYQTNQMNKYIYGWA